MIQVDVTDSGYKIDTSKIKATVIKTLEDHAVNYDAVVSVAIVSKAEMEKLNKLYYKDEIYEHPVFTFPENVEDNTFTFPPSKKKYLGQIVINYDMAKENDTFCALTEHACLHLLGIHHH